MDVPALSALFVMTVLGCITALAHYVSSDCGSVAERVTHGVFIASACCMAVAGGILIKGLLG